MSLYPDSESKMKWQTITPLTSEADSKDKSSADKRPVKFKNNQMGDLIPMKIGSLYPVDNTTFFLEEFISSKT